MLACVGWALKRFYLRRAFSIELFASFERYMNWKAMLEGAMKNVHPKQKSKDNSSMSRKQEIDGIHSEFQKRFPNEKACFDVLLKQRIVLGTMRCLFCSGVAISHRKGSRKVKCESCKRRFSLTSDTFYADLRLIRDWIMYGVFLENGVVLNATEFAQIAGVSYDSAWRISRKHWSVIESEMPADIESVASAEFSQVFARRSRETPRRQHPVAEEAGIEDQPASKKDDQQVVESVIIEPFSEQSRKIYESLSNGPMDQDGLCARLNVAPAEISISLLMMELAGAVVRVDGGLYAKPGATVKFPIAPVSLVSWSCVEGVGP